MRASLCECVCVCLRACVRVCVRACMCISALKQPAAPGVTRYSVYTCLRHVTPHSAQRRERGGGGGRKRKRGRETDIVRERGGEREGEKGREK